MKDDCKALNLKEIQSKLEIARKKASPIYITETNTTILQKASVLIPFVCVDGCWSLIYTRRSDALKNHRGQVSFPGGGSEKADQSPIDTALRETYEEIGIQKSGIHIIDNMPDFVTNSNFIVTPVVAWVDWPVPLSISHKEVSRVFTIPIEWLRNKENWEERLYEFPNGLYGSVIFYNLFDGELLWGVSAKITIELFNILGADFIK